VGDYPFTYLRRCFLPEKEFDWEGDRPLNRHLSETLIYELHVRGFTNHQSASVLAPGTFRGLTEKIPWLLSLGVTAVELMPVNEFDEVADERVNPQTGERLVNFWGYNSCAFFAPKASYAASALEGGQVNEFREMVKEFHKAGIEIILDVVFNHTGEGGAGGPVVSFKGLDNDVYYMIDDEGGYRNYSGCGNTMNCNHPRVRKLIMDCLHYWVAEMHVDGFRFDLASVLGRDSQGNVLANPPVLEEIAQDPILASTKIIAEAWDAAGLYQVGSFPAWGRWAEWNGRYRDDVRRFLRGDEGSSSALATRIAGSSDLYADDGRSPQHSINFVTCHDGFTLHDLFSYEEKHNLGNGENDRDGDNCNLSSNLGVEGPTVRTGVQRLRRRQARNALVIMMLSQGTPMLLAGDEFMRSQAGNNNAYCQDNEISWVDWSLAEREKTQVEFFRRMIKLRSRFASLRRESFFTGEIEPGCLVPDISWHGCKPGEPDFEAGKPLLAFLLAGGKTAGGCEPAIYAACNMTLRPKTFVLPTSPDGDWRVKVDTVRGIVYQDGSVPLVEVDRIRVRARSIIVLVSQAVRGE
jgi:glycogen operon protein